jgi:penicillin-binding protein 2
VVTPNQELFDPGKITIFNTYYPNDPGQAKEFVCWKEEGHGEISYLEAIAESCNIYFYKVGGGYPGEVEGGGLGIERLGLYARALGYGAPLGIDLVGEEAGLIPDPYWKRINLGESWSLGDTYNATTGQGFVLATPLQVLTSIATIANGGRVMWPHIASEILDGEANVVESIEPCVLWDISDGVITALEDIAANCPSMPDWVREEIINSRDSTPDLNIEPWVIELAQEGMHMVTTQGTAFGRADLENISSGGKTGTGEFCDEFAREKNLCSPGIWPTHSWYAGFAPFEDPEIIVLAFVYNGGEGAVTAGPVVRQVLEAYFDLKAVDASLQF